MISVLQAAVKASIHDYYGERVGKTMNHVYLTTFPAQKSKAVLLYLIKLIRKKGRSALNKYRRKLRTSTSRF